MGGESWDGSKRGVGVGEGKLATRYLRRSPSLPLAEARAMNPLRPPCFLEPAICLMKSG